MLIEHTENELIIKVSSKDANLNEVERLVRTIRYKELVSKSTGTDEDANMLAEEINAGWWNRNKDAFTK